MTKLKNQKIEVNGIKFDSKREAKRYKELMLLMEAGEISDLRLQVKFNLLPKQRDSNGKAIRAVDYIADFVYFRGDQQVVEDAKGYRNPKAATYAIFVLKKKMMKYFHDIDIVEV